MTVTFTYDPSSAIGQVRILISDTNIGRTTPSYATRDAWSCVFSDEEITSFYSLDVTGTPFGVAALALRAVAASKVLLVHYAQATLESSSYNIGALASDLTTLADKYDEIAVSGTGPAIAIGGPSDSIFAAREDLVLSYLSGEISFIPEDME